MMKKQILTLAAALLLGIETVRAHCPLCTIGAAAVAGGAAVLGVSNAAIGIFIGAFAVSMGWWFGNILKKQFIPYQKPALIVFSFVTTILPMMAFLSDVHPLYLPWLGAYGTAFAVDVFLAGSLMGGIIVSITPWMSKRITALRNGKAIPFQGTLLTLGLLLVAGIIVQIMS